MDEMRTTNQVEEVNKHLKEIPKEAEERRFENQSQTGKNEKAIEPFVSRIRPVGKPAGLIRDTNGKPKNLADHKFHKQKNSVGRIFTLTLFYSSLCQYVITNDLQQLGSFL